MEKEAQLGQIKRSMVSLDSALSLSAGHKPLRQQHLVVLFKSETDTVRCE